MRWSHGWALIQCPDLVLHPEWECEIGTLSPTPRAPGWNLLFSHSCRQSQAGKTGLKSQSSVRVKREDNDGKKKCYMLSAVCEDRFHSRKKIMPGIQAVSFEMYLNPMTRL